MNFFWKPKPVPVFRTRFADEIVCEFAAPPHASNCAVILAAGAPTYPGKRERVMNAIARSGYWVFVPRYRGSWESDGEFLARPPSEDILDVVSGIASGFTALQTGETFRIPEPRVFLIGGSFGGAAVILASIDARVEKAVALSPLVDWTKQEGTDEPLEQMATLLPAAWGNGYRGDPSAWRRLARGDFYNPAHEADRIDGKKLLIAHAMDDTVIPYASVAAFAKLVGATFVPMKKGGHFALGPLTKPRYWRRIRAFLEAPR